MLFILVTLRLSPINFFVSVRGELNPKGSQPLAGGKAVRPPPPDIGNNRNDPGRGRSLQRGCDPSGSDWFALLTGG
jgi:hypothetical protein